MGEIISEPCYQCKQPIYMPKDVQTFLRTSHQRFFCLHGHGQAYLAGESDETLLRRERDRLKQQLAQKDDEIKWQRGAKERALEDAEHQKRRANGYKGHAAKITKRAKAGVCPCCNRHFTALERHMTTQHPEFTADVPEPLRVVQGGKP